MPYIINIFNLEKSAEHPKAGLWAHDERSQKGVNSQSFAHF